MTWLDAMLGWIASFVNDLARRHVIDSHTGLCQSTDILSIDDNKSNCSDVSDSVLDEQVINCLIDNKQKGEMDVDCLHDECIKTSERLKDLDELARSVMDDCKNQKVWKKDLKCGKKILVRYYK